MIKTVIFDMDGLMFDTEHLSNEAWCEAGKKLDITIDPEMLNSMKGTNRVESEKIIRSYLGENIHLEYLRTLKQEYVDQYLKENGVPVKKGLTELLSYLKTHGYNTVVATSTSEEKAEKLLKMADVEKYFDHLIFGNMVERGKPEPDIFLEAAHRAYTAPEKCLVLEDSLKGVEAAYVAGCQVIMIPDCIPANERTREIADDIVESLYDVLEMFRTLDA
ncbi:MAG: HAD family phosphatase [Lachnospiraceae bacterium]|nr:HAD family phosphatase [Lachnospiraceae bacterium]